MKLDDEDREWINGRIAIALIIVIVYIGVLALAFVLMTNDRADFTAQQKAKISALCEKARVELNGMAN